MPLGAFVNAIPAPVFLLVHLVGFLAGAFFAYRSFEGEAKLFGWGFSLYAIAEIVYMTYHLDWTVVLFAHTIAEVLDLVGFGLIFAAAAQTVLGTRTAGTPRRAEAPGA
ncbi:MAG: hypothetical protein HY689_03390 [Chloroflexi bacterium]|nr:hypothetical protein [Chloroflexota bacterium]